MDLTLMYIYTSYLSRNVHGNHDTHFLIFSVLLTHRTYYNASDKKAGSLSAAVSRTYYAVAASTSSSRGVTKITEYIIPPLEFTRRMTRAKMLKNTVVIYTENKRVRWGTIKKRRARSFVISVSLTSLSRANTVICP